MTKTKSTKRALLLSALSLLMCVSMLIGSTFAWFTDSVTAGNNVIKSGTLDVEMHWADGKTDPANTTWTDASTGAIFNNDLWEPGYTEVRHIKISNVGTLALKYQLNIYANGDVSKLADAIDVYFVDPAVQVADRTALDGVEPVGTLTQVLAGMPGNVSGDLNAGDSNVVTLALKMRESAGNEYQGLEIGSDFVIQLLATQLTYEDDSFDDQYDANAEFLQVNTSAAIVNNNGKLGETVVLTADMPAGTIKVTVPANAQLSSADVADLKLTVKSAANGYGGTLAANQVATGYEIYVDGISDGLNPFVGNYGNIYNSKKISVELPIGADRTDVKVYQDGFEPNGNKNYDAATGIVTFQTNYFTPYGSAQKSNITVVYTKSSVNEKALVEAIENLNGNPGTVTFKSTIDDQVSVNNIAGALNGTSGITLVGETKDDPIIKANGATVTADALTIKHTTIQATGTTTINGNNTTVEDVDYQAAGGGLTVSGSNTTVKETSITGSASNGLLTLNAPASSTATMTGCEIKESATGFGQSKGVKIDNLKGTVEIDDCDISVKGWGVELGSSSGTRSGTVNISNSTIDCSGLGVKNVTAANFTKVIFANTWYNSAITFEISATTSTFTDCEFKNNVNFSRCSPMNSTLTFVFDNCTVNGVDITAANVDTILNFTDVADANTHITAIVNGTTVTIK